MTDTEKHTLSPVDEFLLELSKNRPGKEIAAKLATAAKNVLSPKRNGHNATQNYDYLRTEDTVKSAKDAYAQEGLLVTYVPLLPSMSESTVPTRHGTQRLVKLALVGTVTDPESGSTYQFPAYGEGTDSGDKAVYKAMTGGRKYGHLFLLDIAVGLDPEEDGRNRKDQLPNNPPAPLDDTQKAIIDRLEKELGEAKLNALITRATSGASKNRSQIGAGRANLVINLAKREHPQLFPNGASSQVAPDPDAEQKAARVAEIRAKKDELKLDGKAVHDLVKSATNGSRTSLTDPKITLEELDAIKALLDQAQAA